MTIEFKILGRTRLRVNDMFIGDWGAPKERGVLAVLLLHAGKAVPVRILAEWVWPEGKAPRDPIGTLYTYTTRIRSALRRMAVSSELVNEDSAYRLIVDPSTIDYVYFRQLAGEARKVGNDGQFEQACRLLESALELWQDDPLVDLDTERADNWRRVMIRDDWLPANNALLYGLNKIGAHEEMLHLAKSIQVDHDLDVLLAKRRLQALYALNRNEEAVEYFLDFHQRARSANPARADELRGFHDGLLELKQRRGVHATRAGAVPIPRHLPYDVDEFAGRMELLDELDRLVAGRVKPRLIVLDGIPGVGKTALAVHWANRVRSRFPDGYWFVNLNGFGEGPSVDEGEVVAGLLEAFQVAADCPPTVEARRAKLRDVLSGRQMLIVLDNAHDARHVESLIPLLSGSVVVVTSRVRLSELAVRHGARCYTVPPLDQDLATAWLKDRLAGRAAAEPEAVSHLAGLGAGLPLALGIIGEYVAAQHRKPLRDFVVQLRQRRAVLKLGDNGSQPSVSLRAVFDCSFRELRPEQQRLFGLLGLYPGRAFSPQVAAALAGTTTAEVRDQLDGLVWARLLDSQEGDKYAFHDLLRDYAAERVDTGESEQERGLAALRMVDWFLHTCNNADRRLFAYREGVPMLPLTPGVEPLTFDGDEEAMDWSVRERAEVTCAIQYAAAVGLHEQVWRMVNAAGEVLMRHGFKDDVIQGLTAAVESARCAGDRFGEAGSLNNLGLASSRFYDYEEAERCYRRGLELSVEIDAQIGVAVSLRNIADLLARRGEFEEAMSVFGRALAISRRENYVDTEAGILHRMGDAMLRRGRLDDALTHLHLAWGLRERNNDAAGRGATLGLIATIHLERGDHLGALSFAHQAIVELKRTHQLGLEGQTSAIIAMVHRNLGDIEKAAFYAERAVDLTRQARDPLRQATAQDVLGQVRWRQARHGEARECWELAHSLYSDLGDSRAAGIRAQLDEWVEPELSPISTTAESRSPVGEVERA